MVETLSQDSLTAGRTTSSELPIDAATMFSDHTGTHKPRIEKQQRKLLGKVSFLREFLEEGEQVLRISTAVSPTSLLEQMTTGFIFVYIKRCLLVFTDRRIFHVPTTQRYEYRQSVAQIRFGDLESIEQKWSRLKISYKAAEKEEFLYVSRADRKKIRALLEGAGKDGVGSEAGKRVHLCPQCTAELQANRYDCASCGKTFKTSRKARNLSILLPGGGYFYTGHPFLGITDAVIEIFLLSIVVVSLIPTAAAPNGDLFAAGLFGFLFLIEKAITVYHANHFVKEYIPAEGVKIRRSPLRLALSGIGLVALLAFLGLGILGSLVDMGYTPSERVLAGQNLPDQQYNELISEGIISRDETVEYFFSEGVLSVKEGGSVLTDTRVVAYEQDENDEILAYYILNEDIRSVTLVQQGDSMNYSVYQVETDYEDDWIYLVLPHENGDGERFANAVRAKIRAPR